MQDLQDSLSARDEEYKKSNDEILAIMESNRQVMADLEAERNKPSPPKETPSQSIERKPDVIPPLDEVAGPRYKEAVEGLNTFGLWQMVAAGLGVGGPAGMGVAIAGWLVSRRMQKRIKKRRSGGRREESFR